MDWLELVKQTGDAPFKVLLLAGLGHAIWELSRMRRFLQKIDISIAVSNTELRELRGRIARLERKK